MDKKNFISVCKNDIGRNNKNNWVDPVPTIRVSSAKHGKVLMRTFLAGIVDRDGNVVAEVVCNRDGSLVVGCGAKTGIITQYSVINLDKAN